MGKKGKSENVQVIVRVRPFNEREKREQGVEVTSLDFATQTVAVREAGVEGRSFSFDAVYNNDFSQKDIYLQSIHPLVEAVLNGYNSTIFAYGQSGTGKTYTMAGDLNKKEQYGIIPNALNHIFEYVQDQTSETVEFNVQASFVELYLGNCRDLLTAEHANLELRVNQQQQFYVKDLTMHNVGSTMSAMDLMNEGLSRREVKSTKLNADSSRSHSVFTVYIRRHDKQQDTRTEAKLMLVDLAGSERQSKTEAEGQALKEGSAINQSLTALGTVIDCLVHQKPHIPYRSSHLTMLLKDGLGGNSRTVIVGTLSPSHTNYQETVSTLRFVDRAKQIKNKPKLQMDPKDAKIHELTEELKSLKERFGLINENGEEIDGGGDDDDGADAGEDGKRKEKYNKSYESQIEELKGRVEQLEVQLMDAKEEKERSYQEVATMEGKIHQEREEFKKQLEEAKEQQQNILDLQELDRAVGGGSVADQLNDLRKICKNFFATIDPDGKVVPVSKTESDFPSSEKISNAFHLLETNLLLNHEGKNNNNSSSGFNAIIGGSPTKSGEEGQFSLSRRRSFAGKTLDSVQKSVEGDGKSNSSKSSTTGDNKKSSSTDNKKKKTTTITAGDSSSSSNNSNSSNAMTNAELDDKIIQDALKKLESNNDNNNNIEAAKQIIDDLLMRQRLASHRAMVDVLKRSEEENGGDNNNDNNNNSDEKTVLAAYDHANDEIERLTDAVVNQKQLAAKAKSIADKRAEEIASLKTQLQKSKDEMAAKHMQHASEIEMVQSNIISQNNKKMEKLIAKHTKDLQKEKKLRDGLQHQISTAEDERDEALRQYDVLVMEHESMMASFEQSKLEQMRLVAQSGGKGNGMIDSSAGGYGGGTNRGSSSDSGNMMPIPSNLAQTQQQKQIDRLREGVNRAQSSNNNNNNNAFNSTNHLMNNSGASPLTTMPSANNNNSGRSPRPMGNALPPMNGNGASSSTARGMPNSLPPLGGPSTARY